MASTAPSHRLSPPRAADTYPLPEGAHPLAHGEVAVHPSCAGDYMEFGVFTAESTNKTAKWRKHNCHHSCPPIYGFDTFTGAALPCPGRLW